ncbi:hypothetical protein JVT61DRAFT_744 [Boletus reticuloceps]|uniref:Uncharacterized protein n=1 Tax=Boletus reticuloceps TaxID=495285 RepID=A0A8I3AH19_9AGAM|nr:hypothetical protein JVT61DRAFT_744 [Boletus reticuloceps]
MMEPMLLKTVAAYLRSNRTFEGLLPIQLVYSEQRDYLKIVGVDELEHRRAKRTTYEHPLNGTMLLTFVYDAGLQQGALGVVKTPFFAMKQTAASRDYVNVEDADVPIIRTIIDELEDEQALIDSTRTNSIITTYYVAAGKKSGLLPIVVSLSDDENFQIPNRRSLMNGTVAARSCVVPVSRNGHQKKFVCVFDERRHNNDKQDCPYLVLGLCHGYHVHNLSEDDVMDVIDVLCHVQNEVPCAA